MRRSREIKPYFVGQQRWPGGFENVWSVGGLQVVHTHDYSRGGKINRSYRFSGRSFRALDDAIAAMTKANNERVHG